jgi:LmbE family N-acetylglucosaminyl deacetylase
MKNENYTDTKYSCNYLSFELFFKRKAIALLNIDAAECTLYDNLGDAFLNPYLKGFKDKKLKLKLVKDAGNWQIISNREIFVNGVTWRKRIIRDGDKIYLGEYRLVFQGNFEENLNPVPIPDKAVKRKKILRLTEAAALVLSVSFLWYCTTMNHNPEKNLIENNSVHTGHESELTYKNSEQYDELQDSQALKKLDLNDSTLNPDDKVMTPVVVYAPGEDPLPRKLDVLFIHAHPDDESLDYGLYMSEASAAGKSIGLLVFTDGDSGFDKFPDRPIDGFYKDTYLKGEELAQVRVKEAEQALTVLGARIYLRMGLWNRAYTNEEASKSVDTILSEWGGYDYLTNKLVGIFEKFQPEVIVSPDGPGKANEHFEHEAVGLISEKAVSAYNNKNPGLLKAYLKLVDVQQTAAYEGIPLLYIDDKGDNNYKEQKRLALMQHQTQADASYFGIRRLDDYPIEYYIIHYRSEFLDSVTLACLNNKIDNTISSSTF